MIVYDEIYTKADMIRESANRSLDAKTRRLLARRDAWLRDIDPSGLFHRLFDMLPGVAFFAKNRKGEAMFVNQTLLRHYGMNDELDMIGKTDIDLAPESVVRGWLSDDARVYETGEPILNRVELWFDEHGVLGWHLTHKLPIRSRTGEIIGIMGVIQSHRDTEDFVQPFVEIAPVIRHIRQHFHEQLHIHELAAMVGVSERQLERRFHDILGIGPYEFITKTRLVSACRALRESSKTLATIAVDHGFSDQSSFTRHFRKHIGQTPARFRRSAASGVSR